MTDQVQRAATTERGPERDALQKFANDFKEKKGFYTGVAVVTIVVVIALLAIKKLGGGEAEDHFSPVWSAYSAATDRIVQNRSATDELADLDRAVETARGTSAEGAALWLGAIAHYGSAFTKDKLSFEDRKPHLEAARKALQDLKDPRFDYFPPALSRWFTASGKPPVDRLLGQVEADLTWSEANTYSEPKSADAPTAVLRTDAGDIHLRFYPDLAPKHVENFLMLAKRGAYNGTAFHFVRGGESPIGVSGGDPLTYFYNDGLKKDHVLRWGNGGTGYDVPAEASRFRMVHRRGIVTAQRRENADWDNGAQFQILLDSDPNLDRTYSPFATVVEGMNVVDTIAARPTAANHPVFKDDPAFKSLDAQGLIVDPVWIQKVIVYNEAGHADKHDFPLDEGEKKLATLGSSTLKPLKDEELRATRKLVDPRETKDFRPGLDIPFPSDIGDLSSAKPEGERRVAEKASATGQEPEKKDDAVEEPAKEEEKE
ncbi:MAG: peptidylprolyl isomerase [Planctomycetota bacterium]|jgi:peptidyl-prolyl cis-trans isomerase B (cyclophilin B)